MTNSKNLLLEVATRLTDPTGRNCGGRNSSTAGKCTMQVSFCCRRRNIETRLNEYQRAHCAKTPPTERKAQYANRSALNLQASMSQMPCRSPLYERTFLESIGAHARMFGLIFTGALDISSHFANFPVFDIAASVTHLAMR